jgi:LacI family transcriptional regulator
MDKRVTQKDIADKLGVHVSTVSLALKNHPRISDEKKKEVLETAEKMGYRPDPQLSALIHYRSKNQETKERPRIAFLTNWDEKNKWRTNYAHNCFYEGAEDQATKLGYSLEHFWIGEPGMTGKRLSRIIYNRGIKGVIISSFQYPQEDYEFDWTKFCSVKIDNLPLNLQAHTVRNDHLNIVRTAIRKTHEKGYKKIGLCLQENWGETVDYLWSAGFLWERSHLLKDNSVPTVYLKYEDEKVFQEWYKKHKPDAIISINKFAINWLESMNLELGEDVGYVDLNAIPGETISGVSQKHTYVGKAATDTLHSLMIRNEYGLPESPIVSMVAGEWIEGLSLK